MNKDLHNRIRSLPAVFANMMEHCNRNIDYINSLDDITLSDDWKLDIEWGMKFCDVLHDQVSEMCSKLEMILNKDK